MFPIMVTCLDHSRGGMGRGSQLVIEDMPKLGVVAEWGTSLCLFLKDSSLYRSFAERQKQSQREFLGKGGPWDL